MPVTVKVNGVFNSLVHKGSNGISIATIPDVCKTPSPGGPVPIPYPNISQSAMLSKGTTTVKADGGMMIAIKGSEFSLSNGDQPGTAGGVKSSTFMRESTWILYSFDVKMEGKGACRFTDKKFQNHENTVDMVGVLQVPVVTVDLAKIGDTKAEACKKLEEKEVKEEPKPHEPRPQALPCKDVTCPSCKAGMLPEDYEAIRKTAGDKGVCVSMRDTNKDCLKHLNKPDVESKGHDVMTKTFEEATLPDGYKDQAGLVSRNLTKKPVPPAKCAGTDLDLARTKDGSPLTGDYDMHDILPAGGGKKIGGAEESQLIEDLNEAIAAAHGNPDWPDRVKHGAQNNYYDYLKAHPKEFEEVLAKQKAGAPPSVLLRPDEALEKGKGGLTVFDGKTKPATVYRLETTEDVVNMYRCKGAPLPEQWDIQYKDAKGQMKGLPPPRIDVTR